MCLPCASSPSHPLGRWVFPTGLPNLPAVSPALPGGPATWTCPDSLSQPHLRGATGRLSAPISAQGQHPRGPQSPGRGDAASPEGSRGPVAGAWEAGPGRGWPGGEARDQGLQQGTRLEEVDCSRSPDLFPHSPCPSSQHRHHELAPQEGARGVLSGVARFLLKTAVQPQRPSPWAGWTCGRLLVAMSGDRGYRGLSGLGRRKRGSPASVQGRRPSPAVGRPAGEAKRLGLAEATGQGLG